MSANIAPISVDELSRFPEFKNHKTVFRISDPDSGLQGFISLHNTNLGPAIGGTRYWHYETEDEALRDSLRLSRAMTYKCAIAKVPFGGGKGVLMAPKGSASKTDAYLISYTEILKKLGEDFFTGEDVGLTEHDVEILEKNSNHIVGRPEVGGLPAKWAALSVFFAMETALEKKTGSSSFQGRTVAIRGLGGVGMDLCGLLGEAGASLIGADIHPNRVALAKEKYPAIEIVSPEIIHSSKADVFAPCALGDEFNEKTIQELSSEIVCGAANNQLASEEDGLRLFQKGVLYIPDYVANAGGLISVADELNPDGYSQARVEEKILEIKDTVREIIDISTKEHKSTNVVADTIAEKRFLHTV